MNKKAMIKVAIRESLKKRPNDLVTLERLNVNTVSLNFGPWVSEFTFSEYDDNGDPSTEEEHDDIFDAIQLIIDEHNG